jgi:Quercetinase C-terminal cupin domain
VTLASGDPTEADALFINTEARVLGATLKAGEAIVQPLPQGRRAYVVSTKGPATASSPQCRRPSAIGVLGPKRFGPGKRRRLFRR